MIGRITVAGSLAQKPHQAGHTWQFLQYLLGFRRLGWDVLFLDTLHPDMRRDLRYVDAVMREFGLEQSYSVAVGGGSHLGLPRARVLKHLADSDLLINVMGFLTDEELLEAVGRRVFLDTDPGFGQMWRELELADIFSGHDAYVTIGERIGRPDCAVPTCGLRWVTTPQPVALGQWPAVPDHAGRAFTTVASWRGAYGPIDYRGRRYGLRVHEFRKFADLPRVSGGDFELALDIHPAEKADLRLLGEGGWSLADPGRIARTPDAYRRYIQRSRAELMVAKGMYVESRSGWFSERSICYLASGRPVLAQDTGLAELYPVGEGLLTFSTLEEAVAGVEEIRANYPRHAAAARELAEGHFDSDKVLARLVHALL
jgi:hypothetical protein